MQKDGFLVCWRVLSARPQRKKAAAKYMTCLVPAKAYSISRMEMHPRMPGEGYDGFKQRNAERIPNCSGRSIPTVPSSSSSTASLWQNRGGASSPQQWSGKILWLILALLFGTFGVTQGNDYGAYFSTSRVHLSIPTSEELVAVLHNHPLLNLSSLHQDNDEQYHYRIEGKSDKYLKINSSTGEVWITSKLQQLQNSTEFIISATNKRDNLKLSLTITPIIVEENRLSQFCEKHLHELCFWESAAYKIRENEPANFRLGPLGPNHYHQLCAPGSLLYSLNNASDYLYARNGFLYTRAPLDHDSPRPGPLLQASVRCTVKSSENSVATEINKTIAVTVLDQNDNMAHVQDVTPSPIVLDDPRIFEHTPIPHLKILFVDNDSIAVNNHIHFQLLNDTYHLFRPNCSSYELTHTAAARQTAFLCELIANKSGILPEGQYCVVLQLLDESVSHNSGRNASTNATICLSPNYRHLPHPQPLIGDNHPPTEPKRSGNKKRANLANFTYPAQVDLVTSVYRYARIAQPPNMYDQIKEISADLKYEIIKNPLNAFDITKLGGIIYIKDVTSIKTQPPGVGLNLTVKWFNHNATIRIKLKPAEISCDASHPEDFCSKHTQESCNSSCGVGSITGKCTFREAEPQFSFAKSATDNYSTCSPDLVYCPDMVCDPLEDMAYKENVQICPQDCVAHGKLVGATHGVHQGIQRGIQMSGSPCQCFETGRCECTDGYKIREEDKKPKKPRTKATTAGTSTTTETVPLKNGTAVAPAAVRDGSYYHTGLMSGPITPFYLIAIVIVPMIIAVLLIFYCFTRKVSLKKKLADANSIPMNMVSNETEVFNVDLTLNSRINDINFKIDFDSKWEFPRANLILDITLGEGEFGKVLKGYATDLPEKPGITTVAVKMLKTGANSVELLALLSEYQLLQEVAHPNVIRLLGACTKGDSPLLIIEYCQYGSLKNYLRLSRKLEVMNATDYENAIEPITVKDILSFAWQISKGMAYLTEIKLVHRDLAARNVLLAEGKVCKISDFGLTRDVYEDDAYLKKSKDRVPVKWMAPESLADHIYTTKSDVWAFGVLCWELITLGASPYPGIPPQNLYTLLKQGYRMECPTNCSEEIYSIVRSCWTDDPKLRPSFKHLASQFELLLGRSAKYVDMEQNSISNPVYCENTDETDCAKVSFVKEEQARLESLWTTPTYESATENSTVDSLRYLSPLTDKKALLLQSYDIPRPLIETATIEQKLRYENDVRLRPKRLHNGSGTYPPSSTPTIYINSASHPNLFAKIMEETSFIVPAEYDSPSRQPRRVSYLDMNKNSVNLNLEINNVVDKKQSKDIAFRFSSVDNNLQITGLSPVQNDQDAVIPIEDNTAVTDGEGKDEVDFPCKKKLVENIPHTATVTSTV